MQLITHVETWIPPDPFICWQQSELLCCIVFLVVVWIDQDGFSVLCRDIVNEQCHRNIYGVVPKTLRPISELSSEEKSVLSLRVSSNLSFICKYHEINFLSQYHHRFVCICCDPLKVHKILVFKGHVVFWDYHLCRAWKK